MKINPACDNCRNEILKFADALQLNQLYDGHTECICIVGPITSFVTP